MSDNTQPQTVNLQFPQIEPTKFEKGVQIASTIIVLASVAVPAGLLSYSLVREMVEERNARRATVRARAARDNVVNIEKQ